MNSLIATVRLDMGRGNKNPLLKIYPNTNVLGLVGSFVEEERLPTYTQEIILQEIKNELQKNRINVWNMQFWEKQNQDSTFLDDETDTFQQYGQKSSQSQNSSEENSIVAYSPIQRLKDNIFTSFIVDESEQTACQGGCVDEPNERSQTISFKQIIKTKIKKVYKYLKGNTQGPYLIPSLINCSDLSTEIIGQLRYFFKEMEEEDLVELTEERFVELAFKLKYSEKFYRLFTKYPEV